MSTLLSVKDLSIRIKQRSLVTNATFCVEKGDAVLLSGQNGIGKSTILNSIMGLRNSEETITGVIDCNGFSNILMLNRNDMQKYRSTIAYVQQKDLYAEMGSVQVRDIISESGEAFGNTQMSCAEVNDLIDEWIPRREDNSRVFNAKSKPAKFSGGEQRLLSILSVIATRSSANLFLIDEPLNNLDFVNARNISNLINKVRMKNPNMGLLMVSHCRIFPFINREIKVTPEGITELSTAYKCHSCFGEPDEQGFYK